MPRAKRYHLHGHVWHITHRCHKKEFLLKFARDRRRWLYWLFEAKKRYGILVLDYIVTSNHIHLLVEDTGERETIPRSLQLVAGRTAQEYNLRKKRKGAFWEDRYHATAIQSGMHLRRCIVYIDMNMVRAGRVKHPDQWETSGYKEIQKSKQRYSIIDRKRLYELTGQTSEEQFRDAQSKWIEESLRGENATREKLWTESVAVGDQSFVDAVKAELGFRARGRRTEKQEPDWVLREDAIPYMPNFEAENGCLCQKNGSNFYDISIITDS